MIKLFPTGLEKTLVFKVFFFGWFFFGPGFFHANPGFLAVIKRHVKCVPKTLSPLPLVYIPQYLVKLKTKKHHSMKIHIHDLLQVVGEVLLDLDMKKFRNEKQVKEEHLKNINKLID